MIPRAVRDLYRNGHSRSVTMFKPICAQLRRCQKENLKPVIELAVEIAREGRSLEESARGLSPSRGLRE